MISQDLKETTFLWSIQIVELRVVFDVSSVIHPLNDWDLLDFPCRGSMRGINVLGTLEHIQPVETGKLCQCFFYWLRISPV